MSISAAKGGFTLRFGPNDQVKMSSTDCLKRLYDKSGCLEVRRQIVPDSRSSCIEGCVAEVGSCQTNERCSSLCQAQSFWKSVGDEAAVFCQVACV